MAGGYPSRVSHFAHRFTRHLAKRCAAQEIGADGCWLVTVIVHTEDAKRYSGAVTFYNEQLMPLCGFSAVSTFARARERAVASGWLHYEPGVKRKPGKYWVLVPKQDNISDDSPIDESTDPLSYSNCSRIREESAQESGRNPVGKRRESAHPSNLIPNPSPNPEASASISCSEVAAGSSPPTAPAVLVFPVVGKGPTEWPLTVSKLAEYEQAFPGVDALQECRNARQWCIDNPTKRKTKTGMAAFLTRWLTKAQNSGTAGASRGSIADVRGNMATRQRMLDKYRTQEVSSE